MKHIFICREYPPAAYPPGGIGTYLRQMAGLLARAGETVHVIGHRWEGAPRAREESEGGRLIVHRVALDEQVKDKWAIPSSRYGGQVPRAMLASRFPAQAFSWQAALLAESLIDGEGIDVVEAQEWEAPLYYLQLRRALDLGPSKRPPCVVHIHSPSEKVFAANEWDTTIADYLPAVSMEAYSIANADAVLCASRYVAEQALSRYGIAPSSLSIIPYPLGDTPWIERGAHIWSAESICHVGRLEPRKGVLELASAAALLAVERPNLRIEFIGGDTPLSATGGSTVGDAIRARTSRSVRRRFRFRGSLDRHGVVDALSRACAAVVPSRWDNLPYSCIEAMSSGLPVIVSPNGGMRELIVDGVSGWVAPDATPTGLASALRRALDTPAGDRERMGGAASETVRRICDNETIIGRHLEMKRRLVESRAPRPIQVTGPARPRLGLVVTHASDERRLDACLSSIRAQTEPPATVCTVRDDSPPGAEIAAARNLAASDAALTGLVFVDSRLRLEPDFLSTCAMLFAQDDRLGLVSGWTHESEPADRVRIQPCPTIPYIWSDQQVTPYVAVRTGPFAEALRHSEATPDESLPNQFDKVMRSGWSAVTYPAVLGSIALDPDDPAATPGALRFSMMALTVQRPHTPLLQWLRACSPDARRAFIWRGLRNPLRSALRLARSA